MAFGHTVAAKAAAAAEASTAKASASASAAVATEPHHTFAHTVLSEYQSTMESEKETDWFAE